ncbi:exported hypothetical protein [Verrucomicrobia bacterium]|nr:exported hypothetical protein [Verrucomicrobiota bacterium]
MNVKVIFACALAVAAVASTICLLETRTPPPSPEISASAEPPALPSSAKAPESSPAFRPNARQENENRMAPASLEAPAATTNRLERLAYIRETFRALAAGDPTNALNAVKNVQEPNEREMALLTLVTEWRHGELSHPNERAFRIDAYGLEAGLGMELAKDPQLALLWADELTTGKSRSALIEEVAKGMVSSDSTAALALGDQLPADERTNFFSAVLAQWAGTDTDAALQWADQLPDPAQQDAAMRAIHSAAPVGIGAALSLKDGYPVINDLVPGTPADLSGQIHRGDRILALAQGDNSFVGTQGLALADIVQMIRGAPGTQLQLQILPGDAPAGAPPQTISVIRDQIRFKR